MNGLWRFFGSLPPHPWAFNGASRREPAISAVMDRFIILIGLMGAGKSNVGKRLAAQLEMPFIDTDDEIELAAGCSIEDIFEEHGEAYFRDGERRVIARLLEGEPAVMATGGGAFMNEETPQEPLGERDRHLAQGRSRTAAQAHPPARQPAAAETGRSARNVAIADRPALSHLRRSGYYRRRRRGTRRRDHRPGTRGVQGAP